MRNLAVFCGSSAGVRPSYAAAAVALADAMATRGIGLVYGGGSVGIMGVIADAALARGLPVIGVIPRHLQEKELGHASLTRLDVVETMHERKARMAELADGFIALPGGIGTLEELFEVFTWGQLGLHARPVALLDVEGYYGALTRFLDTAVTEGFLRSEHRAFLLSGEQAGPLLDRMAEWRAPTVHRWLERGQV
jgi:uncharacterized protein (TIGR00730 family)